MNHTLWSTHPKIKLSPDVACSGGMYGQCGKLYSPWELRTYTAFDGVKRTFHDVSSRGNDPRSDDVRKLSTSFYGSAVFIYGAPKRHLNQEPGMSEICLLDRCQIVWAADRYRDALRDDQPVLLWWSYGLDPSQLHFLELRLLETDGYGRQGMTLEYIEYTSELSIPRLPHRPSNMTELVNTTLHDTNYAVQYFPSTDRYGRKVQNPWKKYYYIPFMKPDDTFHHTSNEGNEPAGYNNRQISFEFKGVALYIYGAPKDELELLVGGEYFHSGVEVCINIQCYPIDNHQTYLNIDGADRHLPVLLWAGDGFSSSQVTHVHIRLTDTESLVGPTKGLGFERAVYTEERLKNSERPVYPGPDHGVDRVETVVAGRLNYERGWWRDAQSPTGSYNWAENKLTDDRLPRWSYRTKAHTMKIYGPPPQAVQDRQLASSRVCLDETCHYIDAEHIYLGVSDDDRFKDVLLWSFEYLNPAEDHTISMELVDRFYDDETRVMVVSRLEWVHTLPRLKQPSYHLPVWGLQKVKSVAASSLNYEHGWWREGLSSTGSFNWAWSRMTDEHPPKWSFKARAHTMRIFGPPPHAVQDRQLASSRVCVDDTCHTLDTQQAYLEVDDNDRLKDVLLWSFENLNPAEYHIASMELAGKVHDDQTRLMVVSHIDWVQTVPWFPAIEDNTFSFGAIFFVLFFVLGGLALLVKKLSASKEEPLLPSPSWSDSPPSYGAMGPSSTASSSPPSIYRIPFGNERGSGSSPMSPLSKRR